MRIIRLFTAVLPLTIVLASLLQSGCAEVENSTGKVLTNAGSVIEHSRSKLFMDPEGTSSSEAKRTTAPEPSRTPEAWRDDRRY